MKGYLFDRTRDCFIIIVSIILHSIFAQNVFYTLSSTQGNVVIDYVENDKRKLFYVAHKCRNE